MCTFWYFIQYKYIYIYIYIYIRTYEYVICSVLFNEFVSIYMCVRMYLCICVSVCMCLCVYFLLWNVIFWTSENANIGTKKGKSCFLRYKSGSCSVCKILFGCPVAHLCIFSSGFKFILFFHLRFFESPLLYYELLLCTFIRGSHYMCLSHAGAQVSDRFW